MSDSDRSPEYISIDGNPIKSPVAICHFKKHRGYLTVRLIKTHGCLKKGCPRLQRLDCPFWEQRKKRKELAKEKRKQRESRAL